MATTDSPLVVNALLVLVSGILLPVALPNEILPGGTTVIGLVALVPGLLAVYRSTSHRDAIGLGALFGVVSTALGNY